MPENQSEMDQIWSAFGLNPQAFPIYYPMGPVDFRLGGTPSGAAGATARLTHSLSNFPHMIFGLRLSNIYALPTTPSADDVQLYRALKEWVDGEQTVRIDLAQQDVVASEMLQLHLTGRAGVFWATFPTTFPMAGGNNIAVNVTRLTAYPQLGGEDVLPQLYGTLVCAVLRADYQTVATHRAIRRGG